MYKIYLSTVVCFLFALSVNAQDKTIIISGEILSTEQVAINKPLIDTRYDVSFEMADGSASTDEDLSSTGLDAGSYTLSITKDASFWEEVRFIRVLPKNDSLPHNGVSTLDLVGTMRYILGIAQPTNMGDLIAMDLNKNQGISALDLVLMRRIILAIDEVYAYVPSWQFIPTEIYDMANQPPYNFGLLNGDIPITFDPDVLEYSDVNFVGIKMGDVNNTFANE